MRILAVSPKILDESLSSTSRDASIRYLSQHADVVLIGRFRRCSEAGINRGYSVIPVRAPRVPVINMAWFLIAATHQVMVALRRDVDVILVEPASVIPAAAGRFLSHRQEKPPIHMDVRTMPVPGGGWRTLLERVFTRIALLVASRVCAGFSAISPGVAAWLAPLTHVDKRRIAIWSTGVDPCLFDPAVHGHSPPNQGGPIRILYHGAIYLSRGLGELLLAVDKAVSSGVAVDLTIVGGGPDFEALERMSMELNIQDHVKIHPPVPLAEIPSIIASHDFGVLPLPDLPCWSTSSPTKLMECMAMGVPVIATDIEAHRSVLDDDAPVVWSQSSDPTALASALACANSSAHALKLRAMNAREEFVRAHSWDAQAQVLLSALEETKRLGARLTSR